MPPIRFGVTSHSCWQVLAWGGLLAGALLLASLFQTIATVGLSATTLASHTGITSSIDPGVDASAGTSTPLVDRDDVRVGSLADASSTTCATQPLYAGHSPWAPLYSRCTDALP